MPPSSITDVLNNNKADVTASAVDATTLKFALMQLLDCNATYLRSHPNLSLTPQQQATWNNWLERLQAGEPLAYVTGKQAFWTLDLRVSPDTLIPRPDTECIVEQALALPTVSPSAAVLDLGTGSGAIALALKSERPNWQLTAVDFSLAALAIAQQNGLDNKLSVNWLHSNWFSNLPKTLQGSFELIISNPPYIDPSDAHLADLQHEPLTALVADNHGLADIQHIIAQAPLWLAPNGYLLIEHGYNQAEAVQQIFNSAGFANVHTIKDYGSNPRVTLGCWQTT